MSDQNIEQMDEDLPQVKFWERNIQRTEVDIQNHIKFYNLDYEFIDRETLLERIKELETSLKQAENAIEKMRPLMLLPEKVKELEETNRLLRRDLDEAARVGKARGLRIKELEEEVRKILCG